MNLPLPGPLRELYAQLGENQKNDTEINLIITWLQNGDRPLWEDVSMKSAAVKTMWAMWDTLVYENHILYRQHHQPNDATPVLQVILPKLMRTSVLKQVHNSCTGGHFGITKTLASIQERYYWPGVHEDVKDWCSSCDLCQQAKAPQKKSRAPLHQYQVGEPLERVALDLTGPFPKSERGNSYLLIIGDYFTKYVEAIPIPDMTATTIARAFVEKFICRYGVPLEILTDQGRQFQSILFTEMCELLEINKTRTSPWRPQTNGMIERFNYSTDAEEIYSTTSKRLG